MHNLKEGNGGTGRDGHRPRDLVQVLEDEFGVHCEPLVRVLWKREAGEFSLQAPAQRSIGLDFIQALGAEDAWKASTVMQAADK
jgi:hypothetical protein